MEFRWGRDFPHPSRLALGLIQHHVQWVPAHSFPGVKRSGRGVDHPPHLSPRLKKEQSYTSVLSQSLHGLMWHSKLWQRSTVCCNVCQPLKTQMVWGRYEILQCLRGHTALEEMSCDLSIHRQLFTNYRDSSAVRTLFLIACQPFEVWSLYKHLKIKFLLYN